jgi:ferrous iron transport protein A
MTTDQSIPLGTLNPGQQGLIKRVKDAQDSLMTLRLLEMGLLEGSVVEVLHEAPFVGDPIAVRVRGALIALRREEANLIEVVLS